MSNAHWTPAFDGSTLGQMGEAGAVIVQDEALQDEVLGERARLTLEEDPSRGLHAVTYAVSGWLLHTRYLADAAAARDALEQLRGALESLLTQLPAEGAGSDEARREAGPLLARFLTRFS